MAARQTRARKRQGLWVCGPKTTEKGHTSTQVSHPISYPSGIRKSVADAVFTRPSIALLHSLVLDAFIVLSALMVQRKAASRGAEVDDGFGDACVWAAEDSRSLGHLMACWHAPWWRQSTRSWSPMSSRHLAY